MTDKRKDKLLRQFGQVLAPNANKQIEKPTTTRPVVQESSREVLSEQIMAWLYSDLR